MNYRVIAFIIFYLAYAPMGFIPFIYESDYNTFVANQSFWVLISITIRVLVSNSQMKIISEALIALNAFELLDEILGLNYYLPKNANANFNKLLLDSLVVGTITIFTFFRLVKQWKKKTYS